MPIPLLLIGFAALSGAVGVGTSVKAAADQKEAKETNESAQAIVDNATERINQSRKNCGKVLNTLGKKKIQILNNEMTDFLNTFESIHNIDFNVSSGLNEVKNMKFDKNDLGELNESVSIAASLASGAAGGAAAGAITAFGAYGAATTFATASTGTAIASLSGAAATNATLAFFGGGSLAAGGLGIAGGTAVLGGLVAGPALAIMGVVAGAKASANKDEAYSNLAKARDYDAKMDTAQKMCANIRMRAAMLYRLLIKMNSVFYPFILKMENIVATSGTDYSKYTSDEKKAIAATFSVAGVIKAILDTAILTKDGKLTPESEKTIEDIDCYWNNNQDTLLS